MRVTRAERKTRSLDLEGNWLLECDCAGAGLGGRAVAVLSVVAADAHRVALGGRENTGGSTTAVGGGAAVWGS